VKADERERVTEYVKNATTPQMIVGNVDIIGTGYDLPELSRAYLTTSIRFTGRIEQYLGRIIRKHPTKPQPIFYDFTDLDQPLLDSQARDRYKTYRKAFPTGKTSIYL
jgi:superfamily II DNA or RNA helicase